MMTIIFFIAVISCWCVSMQIKEAAALVIFSGVFLGMLIASVYLITGGM